MSALKRQKQNILLEIQSLDRDTELRDLSSVEWRHRFALEEKLVKLYEVEEIYW